MYLVHVILRFVMVVQKLLSRVSFVWKSVTVILRS